MRNVRYALRICRDKIRAHCSELFGGDFLLLTAELFQANTLSRREARAFATQDETEQLKSTGIQRRDQYEPILRENTFKLGRPTSLRPRRRQRLNSFKAPGRTLRQSVVY